MKILMLADEHDPMLWEFLDKRRLEGVELILSCGDLPAQYLSFLTCFTHAPIVYVHGNHDSHYEKHPPEGCICADGELIVVNGVRILGLGGCMRYRPGPHMYSEQEMRRRVIQVKRAIWLKHGFDILLTHAPMKGVGDMDDLPHRGFECFRTLVEKHHPRLMAFGHVHASYGRKFQREYTFGSTLCVNACKSYTVDIDFPPPPRRRRRRKRSERETQGETHDDQ